MENYNWKLKGLSKGVDPFAAAKELERLQNIHISLSPEIIVKAAQSKRSVLHLLFEWDDTKAAYNYRIQQARTLLNNIQVTVVTDGESRRIDVYEVTSFKDSYKAIDTFTNEDIEYVKAGIISDLNYLKTKLKLYKEFDKVLYFIEQAIEVIQ
jgi:hypothetical protein